LTFSDYGRQSKRSDCTAGGVCLWASPLASEYLFKFIGRVTAESPRRRAKKVNINWPLRALVGRSGVSHVLGAACDALHSDEVLSTNDA
jgi:hypothetical protein